jgi:hypothetical protein
VRTIQFLQELTDAMVQTMNTLIPCGICLPHDRVSAIRGNVSNVTVGANGMIDLDWARAPEDFTPLSARPSRFGISHDDTR